MKAWIKFTLGILATFINLQAFAGPPEVTAKGGQCFLYEEGTNNGNFRVRNATGQCTWFEDAGLIQKSGDAYKLSDLAVAMGDSLWDAISAALPKPQPPAYYLNVEIKGHQKKVAVIPGRPVLLADAINFAYLGSCLAKGDIVAMRGAVLSGGDTKELEANAATRTPHKPAKSEPATVRSGAWIYNLNILASAPRGDGAVTVTVSGSVAGPTNFNDHDSKRCNGYRPIFESRKVPEITVMVTKNGSIDIPLLGNVRLQVVESAN